MEFLQLDVFADGPYLGNPLAVFHDAAYLSAGQMQSIAREMNLSETSFVLDAKDAAYTVRIFTPAEELPFAGHPTIGTAWALKHLGRVSGQELRQTSAGGETTVRERDGVLWFERGGEASADEDQRDPDVNRRVARSLGLDDGQIGLEAREIGRSGRLRIAWSNAGIRQLMVPVQNMRALEAAWPREPFDLGDAGLGVYCFTAAGAGRIAARGFFPDAGVVEDPATGSAAAALGLYLAARVGDIQFEIAQGVEMRRPSRIHVNGHVGSVEVGGRCELVLRGSLDVVP